VVWGRGGWGNDVTVGLGGRGRRGGKWGCFERGDGLVGFEMTQQGRGEVVQSEEK
jgi:hypothetical protein